MNEFHANVWMDSHCHVQWHSTSTTSSSCCCGSNSTENENQPQRSPIDTLLVDAPFVSCVVCGTHPAIDWHLVAQLATHPPPGVEIIPGFGVHPWFYPTDAIEGEEEENAVDGDSPPSSLKQKGEAGKPWEEWTAQELVVCLEEHLRRFPTAIVGEIGLDKLKGPLAEKDAAQRDFCQSQLDVAAAFKRPVSMHCVRHHGLLLEMLKLASINAKTQKKNAKNSLMPETPIRSPRTSSLFPPALILHGFTGSTDIAQSILKLPHGIGQRIFFGLGATTSMRLKGFATTLVPLLLEPTFAGGGGGGGVGKRRNADGERQATSNNSSNNIGNGSETCHAELKEPRSRILLETDAHHHLLLESSRTSPESKNPGDPSSSSSSSSSLVDVFRLKTSSSTQEGFQSLVECFSKEDLDEISLAYRFVFHSHAHQHQQQQKRI